MAACSFHGGGNETTPGAVAQHVFVSRIRTVIRPGEPLYPYRSRFGARFGARVGLLVAFVVLVIAAGAFFGARQTAGPDGGPHQSRTQSSRTGL
jgi:hypothetical protein